MNLRPPGKWYFWLLLALFVKGLIFILLSNELGFSNDHYIGIGYGDRGGDTNSYLTPVENLINTGQYDPDYRLPGFAALYYLLRLILNITVANNAFVVIQSILAAISVYVLALTALRIFNSVRMFYLVYFCYLIATYSQLLDLYLLTESLSVSASIFAIFYLVRGIQDESKKDLIFAGCWTTWVIFLRPVYAPYILVFGGLIFLYYLLRKNISKGFVFTLAFIIPFTIIDGIWIVRNFSMYRKIQPLTKSIFYPDSIGSYFMDMMNFLQSWGGSYIFWDPSAEIRLLGIDGSNFGVQLPTKENIRIPDNIYTSQFNRDSLYLIQSLVTSLEKKKLSSDSVPIVNAMLKEKLTRYSKSVQEEHPFLYNVTSRLKYFRLFLVHPGTYNLMHDPWTKLGIGRKFVKLAYSAQYIYVLFAGLLGSLWILIRRRNFLELILPFLTLYSVIIFPWIFRLIEARYFVPAFPFMVICAMFVTNEIINRLNANRKSQQ